MINNTKKVFVGLSGGVDSALSAAFLRGQGFDVTGVFIKAWTPPGYPCTWREDRRSAMKVCAILNIPFLTLDLEKEYKKEVVDYMIREYKEGKTPNPDVMCNKEIKFGYFLKFALENGADFVATGHYARNELRETSYELMEGRDKEKDQSYFLWTLSQSELKRIIFPVGNLKKEEVRKLAKKFNLPQATRKDSQGLCFLGKIDMKNFLTNYLKPKIGKVLDLKGEEIGTHSGATLFTLGERHGFVINKKGNNDTPLYVVSKDINKNTITVAPQDFIKKESNSKKMLLESINWVSGSNPDFSKKYLARGRYRQKKFLCTLFPKDKNVEIHFHLEEPDFAEGQSVVFYEGDRCLGGGIIKKNSIIKKWPINI